MAHPPNAAQQIRKGERSFVETGKHLERLFDCLEYTLRSCPLGCKKRLALGAMILHLNDDHHWTREAIAAWVAPPPEPEATPA